uniref:rho-related GTP-binding protein RhoE-like isoform X2 n=1 Tax=Myxine glutinosa TaxID=7769 RepID=UPI0035900C09
MLLQECSKRQSRQGGTAMTTHSIRSKIVVVGDSECGKTSLLHVFAKDSFPEKYVPTVFESYSSSFEVERRRVELSMWDTAGSSYYDYVRPLSYPDSDAVLICFDISRPETLDSVLKKWQAEVREFCPSITVLLVGCKVELRASGEVQDDRGPVTYEQGVSVSRCIGAAAYMECSAKTSKLGVRDLFRMAALAAVSLPEKPEKGARHSLQSARQASQLPVMHEDIPACIPLRQGKAKSCTIM